MRKIQKRYYILIFVLAITAGVFLKGIEDETFTIVHNSTAYAPELDVAYAEKIIDENNKVNINEADIYELDRLYGIGEGFAKRIIDYRTKNGKFEVIQDIMKVSGIGEKIFN
ncbi:MAG: helix-hairpin-helix domain-containing protein, partial [Clostridia bacterium]|nr:helix-hairpin-helix domain-containing protein [Clostridia bacterium]